LTNKPTGVSAFTNDAGYQKIVDDGDTDPENELQYLSKTGSRIVLSNGGGWLNIPDMEADPVFNASPAKNITNAGSGAVITTAERTKLNGIEAGAEVNVQADWNQSSSSADNFIKNKPTNVSAFTNDAGYITSEVDGSVTNELQALRLSNDTIYLSNGGFVKLPASTTSLDGAYNNGSTIIADAGPVTIAGTDGALFSGTYGSGTLPVSGAGTRMMWYPKKAAFRAGYVDGTQWDDSNIGNYSTAVGYNTIASGIGSTAMGDSTSASGIGSTAMGDSTTANGDYSTAMGFHTSARIGSTAMGFQTIANGCYSTAMGYKTTAIEGFSTAMGSITIANGYYSTAMGSSTTASGYNSTAMGYRTTAIGEFSIAMGEGTTASGPLSTAIGYNTNANSFASVAIGLNNIGGGGVPTGWAWVPTDPLFEVGNGTDYNHRSNALTILKNGKVGIGTATPDTTLHIIGSLKMVDGNQATGKVLTSDVNGLASWQTLPPSGGSPLVVPEVVNMAGTYSSETTYNLNDLVSSTTPNVYFYSLITSNIGNTPESSPTAWQQVEFEQLKQIHKTLTLSAPGFTSMISLNLPGTNTTGGRIQYEIRATDGGSQIATEEGVIQYLATPNSITCTAQTTDKLHLGTVNSGCTPGFFNPGSHPGVSVFDNVTFSSPAPIVVHDVYFRVFPSGGQIVGSTVSKVAIRLEP